MSVDILKYEKDGYKPLVDYNDWRVAILNYADFMKKENLKFFERHMETDEVFVLLSGKAYLVHAGNNKFPQKYKAIKMEKNLIYNVKIATWHLTIMSPNSKILIVENRDTNQHNSEYSYLTHEDIKKIEVK